MIDPSFEAIGRGEQPPFWRGGEGPLSDGLTERKYKNNERARGPNYFSIDPLRLEHEAAEFAVMFHVADVSQAASDRMRTPAAQDRF